MHCICSLAPWTPFQHMWLQSAPFWGLGSRGQSLHLCHSSNFRLKLLRVEFSSKQIATRISPHNLPFTDPRNHTVWVLGNQLTVAQAVDGYVGGFMIGTVGCRLYVQLCQMRKRQLYQERRENMSPAALAHTDWRAIGRLKLFFRPHHQMPGDKVSICATLSHGKQAGNVCVQNTDTEAASCQ